MMTSRKEFLEDALKLAEKGRGLVSPNPMVGAVIASGRRVLGRGWHKAFGMPHAEIEALREAGGRAKGATLYVNMEPCCHYGKTPPCTGAIIESGIKEVVCSMEDLNPLVSGKGIAELEKNGIKVRTGVMREEAERLNAPYITYITKKRPYIALKWAQTLDGKTAAYTGDSKWITGEETREFAKKIRFEMDGILVGVKTVIKDNPFLDYRFPPFQTQKSFTAGKRYYKIVLDPFLKMPTEGNIWQNRNSRVLLAVSEGLPAERMEPFSRRENAEFIKLPVYNNRFRLKALMEKLHEKEIGIIMVEGGSETLTSFWEEKLADEIMVFTGNKILGGKRSFASIAGRDSSSFSEAVSVEYSETKILGEDVFIRGKPCFRE
ncbi:MAG: bifunctional diaminohydroxyphosphoribosylaminopyrimidine deaminase/5-amino-6-(5-phosphoribosylamino)uracil reductase RibD [Candidatus Omnitrophica bacterium]|nr:bifunctional diaminohydroxyphosphoribosylaminopyrimidine deaminase/5-amino-6-(5-phosphoribosylamino)uracil reductase RibD [Candidatus Omnitrophota bacterium]